MAYMTTHLNPDCVDILSPRVNFKWSEDCVDWPGGTAPSQVVLLRDKIYVRVTSQLRTRERAAISELHCCSADLSSWTTLTLPMAGVTNFGLGTYHTQLVLVGGMNQSHKVVGDVWVSEDGTEWRQLESLPPLPTPCQKPAVINTGSPEYLIVAGGYADILLYKALDTVFVLGDRQWFFVGHLPILYGILRFTIHNGNLYFFGSRISQCFSCYCKVDSLVAACELVKSGAAFGGQSIISWKTLNMERLTMLPFSFGRQLVGARIYRSIRTHSEIHAYHPFTRSWVHVGNLPVAERPSCAFVHTTGELVVLCGRGNNYRANSKFKVIKASLQVSPYDSDSHFSMSALSKLEAAGIEVFTLLSRSYQQLVAAIGISDAPKNGLKFVINSWLSGQSVRPATWRSLHKVLRELGLEELSQQIEDCLTGTESLMEKSTSVIISSLLQQRSLTLGQLYASLPCYVPPTLKRYIIHQYVAITHQVRRPVSPWLEIECPIVLPFPTPQAPKPRRKPRPPAPLPRPSRRHSADPQATPPPPIVVDPQAVPPQPLSLHPVDYSYKALSLQPLPPLPVDPQAVLPQPLPPRHEDPQAVLPQPLPPHLVDPQAEQPQPLPPHHEDPQTVLPLLQAAPSTTPRPVSPQTTVPQAAPPLPPCPEN